MKANPIRSRLHNRLLVVALLLASLPRGSNSFAIIRSAPTTSFQIIHTASAAMATSIARFPTTLHASKNDDSDNKEEKSPVGLIEQQPPAWTTPGDFTKINEVNPTADTKSAVETTTKAGNSSTAVKVEEQQEELTKTQVLLQKVKEAGTAGAISYALWELGFWGISIPVCVVGYRQIAGHWPDFSNSEDLQKVGAEAFAFVNFARFAVPLRIGLALSTTGWIDENVVKKFFKKDAEWGGMKEGGGDDN